MAKGFPTLIVPESWQVPVNDIAAPEWLATKGQADRAASRVFDVRAYGAVGDGTTDDTAALTACATAAKAAKGTFYVPAHLACRITATVDLVGCGAVQVEGRILVAHTSGVGVIAGHSSRFRDARRILLNEVLWADAATQTNVCVRLVGLKNGDVTVRQCNSVQLYADAANTDISSIAYSTFRFGTLGTLQLFGEPGLSWINSNRISVDRCDRITLDGSYQHNHNRFEVGGLEYVTFTFNVGAWNRVVGVRGEGPCSATFAAGTYKNRIVQTWGSYQAVLWPAITVTDAGIDNAVLTDLQQEAMPLTLARIDAASVTTNLASAWAVGDPARRIIPGFRKVQAPNSFTEWLDTGIFPIETVAPAPGLPGAARIRTLAFVSDTAMWRLKVYVYDANRAPLDGGTTPAGGPYMDTSGGWVWNAGGYYTSSADRGGHLQMAFFNPAVKFARVVFYNGAAGWFRTAQLLAYVQAPSHDGLVEQVRRQIARPLYSAGITATTTTWPTFSLLPAGARIGSTTGTLRVAARADTTLASAAGTGATTVTVASATGMATGDRIAVLLADETTHHTSISGISGAVVTLATALPGPAAAGADVATNRFAFA